MLETNNTKNMCGKKGEKVERGKSGGSCSTQVESDSAEMKYEIKWRGARKATGMSLLFARRRCFICTSRASSLSHTSLASRRSLVNFLHFLFLRRFTFATLRLLRFPLYVKHYVLLLWPLSEALFCQCLSSSLAFSSLCIASFLMCVCVLCFSFCACLL